MHNSQFIIYEINVKIATCRQCRRIRKDTNELVCTLQERTHKNGNVTDSKGPAAAYREVYL